MDAFNADWRFVKMFQHGQHLVANGDSDAERLQAVLDQRRGEYTMARMRIHAHVNGIVENFSK